MPTLTALRRNPEPAVAPTPRDRPPVTQAPPPPTPDHLVDDCLLLAADLLAGRWGQADTVLHDRAMCVGEAIGRAAYELSEQASELGGSQLGLADAANARLTAHLLAATGQRCRIWRWNDEPGRTEAEVIAALHAAATRPVRRLWVRPVAVLCTTYPALIVLGTWLTGRLW